ncbi:MAG: molecular chaperone HtpG [Zetaproteobacteria bacterium CG2_30_46_52]|nr:MAG: molecular chaperone HtpG [Zetaproteobacteria bacterium CG2_30_46_52]
MTKETMNFQTEVKQLLDLMIHSLYSNKEIFLRELISNASDAADKLRFEATTDDALFEGDSDLHVFVAYDKDNKTITISDNGIGMNREEVIANIGTIARSGTKEFFSQLSGDQEKDAHMIGQFGVGFYSSFLVANQVTLTTRRAGLTAEHGVQWISAGDGEFTLETIEKAKRGTEIVLHLRDEAVEYLNDWKLRSVISKYADHIPFPIRMMKPAQIDADGKVTEPAVEETVNQASALWAKSKSDLTDEDYNGFYQHVAHDFEDPIAHLHQRLEGKYEYTILFYVPKRAPFDLWQAEAKHGVKLYVRRVFIMEATEDLMPRYLRFVRGVMDSNDLPLNVSREILQQSPAMDAMKKGATKRVLSWLKDMASNDGETYQTFWNEFGNCLKEGIIEDHSNKKDIAALLRFASTENDEEVTSFADYITRMKEGQDTIYYITAESMAAAKNSPHLEIFRKKGVEVLLLSDRIDEWLTSHLSDFDGKALHSIARGELDLSGIGSEEEKAAEKAEDETNAKEASPIAEKMKAVLADRVKEVRVSSRLVDSPACLISEETDISSNLERILRQAGQEVPEIKPILEINANHILVKRLADADEAKLKLWSNLLFEQSVLAEGALPEDPAGFVKRMNELFATL